MQSALLKVVFLSDFNHGEDFFDLPVKDITYGDAEYTLVTLAAFAAELQRHGSEGASLLNELSKVPEGVLIAIPG